MVSFANAIMTSYVCQQPQDLESALRVITAVKRAYGHPFWTVSDNAMLLALDPTASEDAIRYIIFLVDANRLYDVALGMYDFELVLSIAQNSQKVGQIRTAGTLLTQSLVIQDPKEYIPFLKGLRALDTHYQRHKIDDNLKKYPSALRNLAIAGQDRFDEALTYMQRYELFDVAVEFYANQPERLKVGLKLASQDEAY